MSAGNTPLLTGFPAIRSVPSTRTPQGTLWIGTFGGGLNALRDGKFLQFMRSATAC